MKRFLRWTWRLGLIVVAVVVLGLLALRFFVPADKLVAAAVARIHDQTGVVIQYGDVSLDTWPRVALHVQDLVLVADSDAGAENGDATPLWAVDLRARGLDVGLAWKPLLRRRVELDRLVLEQPVLEVSTAGDQSAEPAVSAAGVAAPSGAAKSGSGAAVAMVLAGMSVRDGRFVWTQDAGDRRIVLEGWHQDVDLGALTFDDQGLADDAPAPIPFRFQVSRMVLEGFHENGAYDWRDAEFETELVWDPAGPSLTWTDGDLGWNGSSFAVDGVFELPDPEGQLDLEWRLVTLDAPRLQRDLPAAVPQLPDTLAAWFSTAPMVVSDFTAEGAVSVPVPTPNDATPVELARGVSFEARTRDLAFTPPGRDELWHADARASMADGRFEAREVTLRPTAGQLEGEMALAPVGDPAAELSFQANLRALPVGTVLTSVLPSSASLFQGEMGGEFTGLLHLGEPEDIRESLRLDGDALLSDGIIHAEQLLSGLDPILGDRLDLKEIDYTSLVHKMHVEDGRYRIEDLVVEGGKTRWSGEGWVGLDGGIDLGLTVLLPAGVQTSQGNLEQLFDALRDEQGRFPLQIRLQGRAARPDVSVETAALEETLRDELEEQLEDALRDELDGLLDKLK